MVAQHNADARTQIHDGSALLAPLLHFQTNEVIANFLATVYDLSQEILRPKSLVLPKYHT